MKTKLIFVSFMLLAVVFVSDAMAQRGRRAPDVKDRQRVEQRAEHRTERSERGMMEYCQLIPDLTEEQEEAIKKLRVEQVERNTHYRNKMDELRVQKRNLMTGTSEGDVDQVIDEMTELRNAQMKENVQHRQNVRELLTEDQRIIFDSKVTRRHDGRGGMGRDRGQSPRTGQRRW